MRQLPVHSMLATEKRAVASLGLLYSFRMLGLFMLLPVLALYAADFEQASPALIGLALGIYGLSQALLQIPFGMLSDRIGRKPVIILGLALFALGSVVAANAISIWGVVLGRALQGSGAVASTILALLSDLTRNTQRTKAMAMLGMTIGLTFAAALLIGPWVSGVYGIHGVFWLTAVLAVAGILLVILVVPTPLRRSGFDGHSSTAMHFIRRVLADRELMRLNAGIFVLHFILTASFVALPLLLRDTLSLPVTQHAWVYLAVMGGSFVAMVPLMIYAERRQKVVQIFLLAVAMLVMSSLVIAAWSDKTSPLLLAVFVFFMAFNLLEANLPSLVSKKSFAAGRGTAMGVYSTFQFLGAFLGGSLGGLAMGQFGAAGVFGLCALLTATWFILARGMEAPRQMLDIVLDYDAEQFAAAQLLEELSGLQGVRDVTLVADDSQAYLKVESDLFRQENLQRYRQGSS